MDLDGWREGLGPRNNIGDRGMSERSRSRIVVLASGRPVKGGQPAAARSASQAQKRVVRCLCQEAKTGRCWIEPPETTGGCFGTQGSSVPSPKFGDKFSGARRPAGKARRARIPGVFERGATPPAGMPRPENVSEFRTRDTSRSVGADRRSEERRVGKECRL